MDRGGHNNVFLEIVLEDSFIIIQSLRAFRRPKLGGLELSGFQVRLTWRGAAEDVISEF